MYNYYCINTMKFCIKKNNEWTSERLRRSLSEWRFFNDLPRWGWRFFQTFIVRGGTYIKNLHSQQNCLWKRMLYLQPKLGKVWLSLSCRDGPIIGIIGIGIGISVYWYFLENRYRYDIYEWKSVSVSVRLKFSKIG